MIKMDGNGKIFFRLKFFNWYEMSFVWHFQMLGLYVIHTFFVGFLTIFVGYCHILCTFALV